MKIPCRKCGSIFLPHSANNAATGLCPACSPTVKLYDAVNTKRRPRKRRKKG